jgi:DNA adenine methylase
VTALSLAEPLPVGRAPVQWYGGKGNMLAKLLPLVPAGGHPYCEPYCGAASLFWSRQPAQVEVLNDLNGDLVGLFRCLQDRATFDELKHRLTWTLYSRAEFARALEIQSSDEADPIDRAWAFFVAQNQGFSGGGAKTIGNWGRNFTSDGGMAAVTNQWLMRLSMLDDWHKRIARVQIDRRDALEVLRYWDTPDAVFYVDPPYMASTRAQGYSNVYRHEADDAHHAALVETLLGLHGAVVVSGYACAAYAPLEAAGWERTDFQTSCHAAGRGRDSGLQGAGAAMKKVQRVETVWRNPRAVEATRKHGCRSQQDFCFHKSATEEMQPCQHPH